MTVLYELLQLVTCPTPDELAAHGVSSIPLPVVVARCIARLPELSSRICLLPSVVMTNGRSVLGIWRWRCIDFLGAIANTKYGDVAKAIIQHCLPSIKLGINWMFEFPSNNLLHTSMMNIVRVLYLYFHVRYHHF